MTEKEKEKVIDWLNGYGIVAFEGLEALDTIERSGITDPLNGLPVGHQPDVVHGNDGVQEGHETFLVVRRREPRWMVVQWEWRPNNQHPVIIHYSSTLEKSVFKIPVGGVMAFEILDEHFVDTFGIRWIAASVT